MAYSCDICGKGKQFGHNVSFSQRKTNKVWKPNLQRHHITLDGSRIAIKVCSSCWRTLAKYQKEAEAKAAAKDPAPAKV
ncbi:MAG TPA: 50S ribosomal protein L28 [Candidatus Saccharimonadales bacterium]|nr:50S ribosomal protein L28 [Candidatus Saccharimonadales bacterium]